MKTIELKIPIAEFKKKLGLKDGYTPIKGVDYFDGNTPIKGVDYFDGKDGSPDTPEQLKPKILAIGKDWLPVSAIKDLELLLGQRMTYSGGPFTTGGSSSLTIDSTPIIGGADTQVLYNKAGVISSDSGFIRDYTNGYFGFGGTPIFFAHFQKTYTNTSTSIPFIFANPVLNPASASSASLRGMQFLVQLQGSTNLTGIHYGILGQMQVESSATTSQVIGAFTNIITGVAAGTITNAQSSYAGIVVNGGTITNAYGYYVPAVNYLGGAVTNLHGLYIEDMTGAGTLNRAITTGLGKVYFGDDVGVQVTPPTSGLHLGSSFATPLRTETGNYTIAATDHTIIMTAIAGTRTATLPTAVTCAGRMYTIKRNSANLVNVAGDGVELIDTANTYALNNPYDSITVQSDGTQWWII